VRATFTPSILRTTTPHISANKIAPLYHRVENKLLFFFPTCSYIIICVLEIFWQSHLLPSLSNDSKRMARAVTCFWKANTRSATQEMSHPSWNQTDHKLGPSLSASLKCHFSFRSYYNFALVFIGQNIVLSNLFSCYLPNLQVKPYKTACNIIFEGYNLLLYEEMLSGRWLPMFQRYKCWVYERLQDYYLNLLAT
jgi:hypothetical protein